MAKRIQRKKIRSGVRKLERARRAEAALARALRMMIVKGRGDIEDVGADR